MLHKEFFGLIFLGFVFWIIAATSPNQRIENACRPVGWGGNVLVSLSALVVPSQQATAQGWFDKLDYGCRYTVWRLFYQEDYNKWKALQAQPVPANATAPAAPGTPAKEGVPELSKTPAADEAPKQ